MSRVRSRGALIRGTNGQSNGIVPLLRTLDASVAAVNQGGRRKGAACVYLEPWHPDIEEFLELRDNTGEDARRTHNLNLANWIPDEFMRRVEADEDVVAVRPRPRCPSCPTCGARSSTRPTARPRPEGRVVRQVQARDLYGRMMRTLAQTGNGWMTFKDAANRTCNQTAAPGNVVHLSNLCTEILEVTRDDETAVCNLGSINLAAHLTADGTGIDWERAARDRAHRGAVPRPGHRHQLLPEPSRPPRPTRAGGRSGSGVMGLQDVFFALRLPFDSAEARELSTRIAEEIYLTALEASADLAEPHGPHPAYAETRAAARRAAPRPLGRRPRPRADAVGRACARGSREHGLRNSLLIAIAPTATIASIAGCYECIEPQVSNLFKRETLSGEFLQVNAALVRELKARGLWTGRGPRRDQAGRGLGPGHRRAARRRADAVPHRVGAAAAGADRPGRRARAVHRPDASR